MEHRCHGGEYAVAAVAVAAAAAAAVLVLFPLIVVQELLPALGHLHNVQSVAFSPQGDFIVSGGRDNVVRVWNADTGEVVWRAVAEPPCTRC